LRGRLYGSPFPESRRRAGRWRLLRRRTYPGRPGNPGLHRLPDPRPMRPHTRGQAMTETYFYEPSRGHGLPHNPFKAIIAPRPIGWISTRDREGRVSLALYSYFNAFCDDPPIIGFSSYGRKDSLNNAEET